MTAARKKYISQCKYWRSNFHQFPVEFSHMHTKNSSRDFIEIPIFFRIWDCYMKEKIFLSWLVYLNLHKKIYFAPFIWNISAGEPIREIVETLPKPKLYRDFLWYKPKLLLLLLKDDPKHVICCGIVKFQWWNSFVLSSGKTCVNE